MKRLFALAVAVLFAGCSVDNSDTSTTQHILTEPVTDQYNLTVHPGDYMYATPAEITAYYEQTMACLGMTADGPEVYYKSFKEYYNGVLGGWGFHTGGVIYINTDDPVTGATRDASTDREVLKHEFIHHILNAVTGDGSNDHGSPYFAQCGLGVSVNN